MDAVEAVAEAAGEESWFDGDVGTHVALAGVNVDASKGNVGANVAIEPRFLSRGFGNGLNGVQIGPAGQFGLE